MHSKNQHNVVSDITKFVVQWFLYARAFAQKLMHFGRCQ